MVPYFLRHGLLLGFPSSFGIHLCLSNASGRSVFDKIVYWKDVISGPE